MLPGVLQSVDMMHDGLEVCVVEHDGPDHA
jgi:hypothetical protein